jgi:hypothetical protein
MSDVLDRVLREARADLGKQAPETVDWAAVDRGLFARIAHEERAERARLTPRAKLAWAASALSLSAAAAAALIVGRGSDRRPLDATQPFAEELGANLVAIEGGGEVLLNGKAAAPGALVHRNDVVETRGAEATFERPGKITFVVQGGSRFAVERVQGALVLGLEAGSVEAQVVPVTKGEAFAVGIGHSRVAVHGTHLRVARDRERVLVDLNEGVVSVGEAPRVGSTTGTLVTAPAHAEFFAEDILGTLTVTHDMSAVRAPVALSGAPLSQPASPAAAPALAPSRIDVTEPRGGSALAGAPVRAERQAAAPASPQVAAADPNAEEAIAAAVRACMVERPSAENVTVSVSTTLYLTLSDDGSVRSARFEPPVAPGVNACAAQSIYRTRFTHGGTATIPVDIKVPSSAP